MNSIKFSNAMKSVETYITVICFFVSAIDALPITSYPLENNPDHLIWQAELFSAGSYYPQDNHPFKGASKKITPKSIFITPNLNFSSTQCPHGFKVDEKGQCIQIININQEDLLVTRLQSILSQTTDKSGNNVKEDYYDYDDESSEPNEPFQVNLPLAIKYNEDQEESSEDEKIPESFLEKPTTERFRHPTHHNTEQAETISFVSYDKRTNFTTSLSDETTNNSDSTKYDFTNSTNTAQVFASNRTNYNNSSKIPIQNDIQLKNDTILNLNNETFENENVNISSTTITTTIFISTDGDEDFVNILNRENETVIQNNNINISTALDNLLQDSELSKDFSFSNKELLLEIDNSTFSPTESSEDNLTSILNNTVSLTNSTRIIEFDTTEKLFDDTDLTTEVDMSGDGSGDKTFAPEVVEITSEKPINDILSLNEEFIGLKVENDTVDNEKDKEALKKQEQKLLELETIDTNDNLASTTDNSKIPLFSISSTNHPLISHVPQHILSNRVEMVHKIVEESKKDQESNSKVRFPSATEELEHHPFYISRITKPDIVRFPESSSIRFPTTTTTITDTISVTNQKRQPTSTLKPDILWLPNVWKVEQNAKKHSMPRFWSRMPLVKDPALERHNTRYKNLPHNLNFNPNYHSIENVRNYYNQNYRHSGSSGPQPHHSYRENSKSPSENFYKEVSAQDSYRVIGQRNLNYKR